MFNWVVLQVDIANIFNIVPRRVIFQRLHVIGGQLFQDTTFVRSFYALQLLLFFSHHSSQGNLFVIQSFIGTYQGDLLGGLLFALAHFHAFHNSINLFPSSLFFSIIDDTHIVGHVSLVSQVFHHFSFQLNLIGLTVQPCKCGIWSPLRFSPTSGFCTLVEGIKVLGVPLGSFSFTSFFFQDAFDNVVQHIDVFFKLGDVQVAFGILTPCFTQRPYYLFHFFLPLSDFQHQLTSFDSTFNHIFGKLLGLGFLECLEVHLIC